ncbi:MAG: hypothetical protein M1429_00325 [Patescibacteria group bacterium]|nr:hypothetical protein [Patescibacteria group bacterium]
MGKIALVVLVVIAVFFGLAWVVNGYPVWRLEYLQPTGHWDFGNLLLMYSYLIFIVHDWLTCTIVGVMVIIAGALVWHYGRSDKPSPPPSYRFKTFLDG